MRNMNCTAPTSTKKTPHARSLIRRYYFVPSQLSSQASREHRRTTLRPSRAVSAAVLSWRYRWRYFLHLRSSSCSWWTSSLEAWPGGFGARSGTTRGCCRHCYPSFPLVGHPIHRLAFSDAPPEHVPRGANEREDEVSRCSAQLTERYFRAGGGGGKPAGQSNTKVTALVVQIHRRCKSQIMSVSARATCICFVPVVHSPTLNSGVGS